MPSPQRAHLVGIILSFVFLLSSPPPARAALPEIPDFLPENALPFKAELLKLHEQRRKGQLEAETRFEDIHGWRILGPHWAAGLDAKGHVLALYDLTVTAGLDGRLPIDLMSLGGPDFTLSHVRELLARAHPRSSADRKRLAQALSRLDQARRSGLSESLLPADWFKQVPWKAEVAAAFDAEARARGPSVFHLSDIDFEKVAISPLLFRKAVAYLGRFGVDFSRFVFERQADGSFAVRVEALAPDAWGEPQPFKLADIQSPREGFYDQVGWTIGTAVLGFIIGEIPVPVVSALVGTAVGRYLTFKKDIIDLHREAARELVAAADEGQANFNPLGSLTHDEIKNAGISLYLSSVTIFSVWNWIFKGAERSWRDTLKDDLTHARQSGELLAKQHETLRYLNPRFAIGTDSQTHLSAWLLAHTNLCGRADPAMAIDYLHPDDPYNERIVIEAASTIVSFATSFIPWFGGVVYSAYDWLVRAPVQYTKDLESRLAAHLENREYFDHESWEHELDLIARQRVNPLELPRDQAEKLAREFRKRFGG